MTTEPIEPGGSPDPAAGIPAGDLGVGGPADESGDDGQPQTPPGYPEAVDPTEGPLVGRDGPDAAS
jgi:hypothetical protein